jgi:hypothetical protein
MKHFTSIEKIDTAILYALELTTSTLGHKSLHDHVRPVYVHLMGFAIVRL